MDRNQNKDTDESRSRSTRHSKNSGEAVKSKPTAKRRRSIRKKNADEVENKTTEIDKETVPDAKASTTEPRQTRARSTKNRPIVISDGDESVESCDDNSQDEDYDGNEECGKTGKEKKKRKLHTKQRVKQIVSARPKKTSRIVKQFMYCTYCGENLSEHLKEGEKVNLKRHFALKHTAALCHEMGWREGPVSSKSFMIHLDTVDQVYQSLKSHGYKVIPACNHFKIIGSDWAVSEVHESERDAYFKGFLSDGSSAFNKYEVLYLKGINVPSSFSDLSKAEETNYDKMNWVPEKPSANNFSLKSYELSNEEIRAHCEEVKEKLSSVVHMWSAHYEEIWKN